MHRLLFFALSGCGISSDIPCAPQLDMGEDASISLKAGAAVVGIKACGVDGAVGCGLNSTRAHDPEPGLVAAFDDATDPRLLLLDLAPGDLSAVDLETVGFYCSGELYDPAPDTGGGWMSDTIVVTLTE
jgi:hypothetical protein